MGREEKSGHRPKLDVRPVATSGRSQLRQGVGSGRRESQQRVLGEGLREFLSNPSFRLIEKTHSVRNETATSTLTLLAN